MLELAAGSTLSSWYEMFGKSGILSSSVRPMSYRLAADGLLIVHLLFVLFVLFGALLAVRWPKLLWFHVAAVLWGALIEFSGALCPLTPLEVKLRQLGGEAGYSGDFIDHYIVRLLYPSGLTRTLQVGLGLLVLILNVSAYIYFFWRRRRGASA